MNSEFEASDRTDMDNMLDLYESSSIQNAFNNRIDEWNDRAYDIMPITRLITILKKIQFNNVMQYHSINMNVQGKYQNALVPQFVPLSCNFQQHIKTFIQIAQYAKVKKGEELISKEEHFEFDNLDEDLKNWLDIFAIWFLYENNGEPGKYLI